MKNHALFLSMTIALGASGANADVYSKFDFQLPNTSAAGSSYGPKIDDAGTNVAFVSSKMNLVTGDDNGYSDVFVKNLRTNVTKLLSRSPIGAGANDSSTSAYGALAISGDGKTIAFVSSASNLLNSADGNIYPDCFFVKLDDNLSPGPIVRLSAPGVVPNFSCVHVAVNYDGSRIAFASNATNMTAPATASNTNVFSYEVATGAVSLISTPGAPLALGTSNTNPSINCIILENPRRCEPTSVGDKVVWQARSNMDPTGYTHIFQRDSLGIVRVDTPYLCSVGVPPAQCGDSFGNGGSSNPAISDDGTITWQSSSKAMVVNDPNGNGTDVFKRSLPFATEAVAQSPVPQATFNGPSFEPSISAVSNEVVFVTSWNGFYSPDNNLSIDLFLKSASAYNLISKSASGGVANSGIRRHDVSALGQRIVYDQNGGNYPGTLTPNIQTSMVAYDRFSNTRHDLEVKVNNGVACTSSLCALTVKNLGPDAATNVTLTVAGSSGNFIVTPPSTPTPWVCLPGLGATICTRITLALNETAVFSVQNLSASANAIRADFGASDLDIDYSNNAALGTLLAN